MSTSTDGWETLHAEGRRLVDGEESVRLSGRTRRARGDLRMIYVEDYLAEAERWMVLAMDASRNIVGQTFGRTNKAAWGAMQNLLDHKGLDMAGQRIAR